MTQPKVYMTNFYTLQYPEGASMTDGMPEELKEVAHEYWGTYPPQHPLIIDIIGIIFFFLFIVNVVGNGLVIYIFLCVKSLRSPVSKAYFFLNFLTR